MAPNYSFDPSKVSATFEIFPKDTYEFQVGEPKAFIRQNAKGNDSYGIRVPLVIKGSKFDGKRTMHTLYMTSEGAQGMAKQFLMAALGYKNSPEEERRFDADLTGEDWNYDVQTGAVGDAWRKMTGQRIVGDLDTEPAKDNAGNLTGEQRQTFVKFYPISVLAEV